MNPRKEAYACWKRLKSEHDRYIATVRLLQQQGESDFLKVQDDMRRYLCLRCAGFLEQVTFIVLDGYLDQKVSGPPRHFLKSVFSQAPNLNVDAFTRLMNRFGPDRAAEFEAFLTRPRRDTLGDLLGIRNDVAHGREFNGRRLEPSGYMKLCEEIYEWLVETFLGESVEVMDETGTRVQGYERTPS